MVDPQHDTNHRAHIGLVVDDKHTRHRNNSRTGSTPACG
jgi:hypothetical protein